jgi:large subunit ribosomal protein L6
MQEVHTHFPIKMEVKGGKILMHSFAGEKKPRSANIVSNVKVEVKGSNIIISGSNVEDVTQTAANVRLATHIKKLDNRIFQDGVYISEE